MKRVLILGAGETNLPIIEKCRKMGLYTIATDFDKDAPGLKMVDKAFVVDTLDKERNLEIAILEKIDGIITISDYPVNTVAYVCEHLDLPGLSPLAAERSTNKYLQRKLLIEKGFNSPHFQMFEDFSEVGEAIKHWTYPLIVKPLDSSASRGVTVIQRFSQCQGAFVEAKNFSKTKRVMIEEFISGKEFSIESLTQDGVTQIIDITEKFIMNDDKHFVEERHIIPAALEQSIKEKLSSYVLDVIRAFEIDNSATHTEIKLTDSGPILIELGARVGGDFITSDLVPLATGVDMLENTVNIALGQPIQVKRSISKHAGVQFLHKANYRRALKFSEEKNQAVKQQVKPFSDAPIQKSSDRLGYFIFQENSRKLLDKKLNFELDET
jgi:biotin carboxylase